MRKNEDITKTKLQDLFDRIDRSLAETSVQMEVLLIGGAAILMQDIRDRATSDIDMAPWKDAERFAELCEQLGVDAQVVGVTTTVDFENVPKIPVFSGQSLFVKAVRPGDLIKLKLERFQRQDEPDIYGIIDKTSLPYETFVGLIREMLLDFVGNEKKIIMAARTVVETKFPDKGEEFRRLIPML